MEVACYISRSLFLLHELGFFCGLLVVALDGLEQGLGLGVGLEMLADWLYQFVQDLGEGRFQIAWVQLPLPEVGCQFLVALVDPMWQGIYLLPPFSGFLCTASLSLAPNTMFLQ